MECREVRELLPAYVDAELGASEALATDAHLQTCADCRAQHAAYASLRTEVAAHATYFEATATLADRIEAALPDAAPVAQPVRPPPSAWRWLNVGGAAATAIAIAWSVGLYLRLPNADDRLADEVVSSHVRSLLSNRLVDVASSDRHAVKPWFNGKLDFVPPVQDATAQGFPLVGGRIDYLDHRTAAALVYRYGQHPINVFVLPAADAARESPAKTRSHNGYNVLNWTRDGMAYWLVSDADATELVKLEEILKAPAQSALREAPSGR